ncbi:MAG TPA: hypothetical protein VMP89_11450 [Solirubrobacteraceae bacterium]|nr:hypothetical protein [Solirubrobacteraceae bacterium]
MNSDWRIWRPAIWLVMLGIAVMLLFSPWYLGAIFFGAAIGSAIRIQQRRRRALAAAAAVKRQPQRRRRSGGKR